MTDEDRQAAAARHVAISRRHLLGLAAGTAAIALALGCRYEPTGLEPPSFFTGYLFRGREFLRFDLATGRVVSGYPRPIAAHWPGLWADGVDTGTLWNNGKAYFFKGEEYIRFDVAAFEADDGYPQPIRGTELWAGLWDGAADASILWTGGKAYFFKGKEYIRYDMTSGQTDDGYPRPIAANWPGLWEDGVEAGVMWTRGKAYFFKGREYIRWDVGAGRVDDGYPRPVGPTWRGSWEGGPDAAILWPDGKA